MLPIQYIIKDGTVLWNGKPVPQADAATFQILGGAWARDAKRIYMQGGAKKFDLASFEFLNAVYVKDAAAVHDWSGAIKGADPATFEALDPGVFFDENICPKAWARGYARDANAVYYHDQMFGKATPLKGADPKTFVSLCNDYGLDAKGVWWQKQKLPKADPATWVPLRRMWSRDRERFFYGSEEKTGIDAERFVVLNAPTIGNFATDGSHYFNSRDEVTREAFTEAVEKYFGQFARWFDVAAYGRLCEYCTGSGDCYCKRKGESGPCARCGGSTKCHVCKGTGRERA